MRILHLIIVVIFCSFQLSYGQPGGLDPSFGHSGLVKADLGESRGTPASKGAVGWQWVRVVVACPITV